MSRRPPRSLRLHREVISTMLKLSILLVALGVPALPASAGPPRSPHPLVGLAEGDITPRSPVRLSGYASRQEPSAGVSQKLRVKALVIGQPARVLLAADLIGIPAWLREEVYQSLRARQIISKPGDLVISATHSHTTPHLEGVLPFMFLEDLPPDDRKAIHEYSRGLVPIFLETALRAYSARKPARLERGEGRVDFAVNRRVIQDGKWKGFGIQEDGPVDHAVPVLRVSDPDGAVRGVLATYACHCTGFQVNLNHAHPDWAGVAERRVEELHPGSIALVTIGCGADQNPHPRGKPEHVEAHGLELAAEIHRLLGRPLEPVSGDIATRFERVPLYFESLPDVETLREQALQEGHAGYAPRKWLETIEKKGELPDHLDYPIQTWIFGDDLAMVFLAGEVVVDYALRLRRELDAKRLWIHAYTNELPAYIASRRLYDEGGYEVDGSMRYYGHPSRLAIDTEDRVSDEVIRQVPHEFYGEETLKTIPKPVDRHEALSTIRVRPDLEVELVAAEPLVEDPVNLTWDQYGRTWVVEMPGYPRGIDGKGTPGGRVKQLHDDDGDGFFDRATLFLEGLSYPNSLLAYRDGLLISASPEIIFARDTNGDGKADQREALLTGFSVWNQQHLVNGFEWSLDGWIHIANGDSGGHVRSTRSGQVVHLRSRDLKFRPETGDIELIAGQTQFGRKRDDWGHWFGCNNTIASWHYPLEDRYLARNPHVRPPPNKVFLTDPPFTPRVYPASRTLVRLNDYSTANRITSACGHIIYRDDFLGEAFRGNSLVCEPVHNLVKREQVFDRGTSFYSRRAPDEQESEIFASTDNWSRPVSVHTGPDGALYVVDMYRYAIEHPEWIPEDWQRRLDLRDGHDRGRIYRLFPRGKRPPPIPDLASLSPEALVARLESSNGWVRDTASRLLIDEKPEGAPALLRRLLASEKALARLHALATLDGLGALTETDIRKGLEDAHPLVQRHAIRLAEPRLEGSPALLARVIALAESESMKVRLQVAATLGATTAEKAGVALGQLILRADDTYLRAACWSSAPPHLEAVVGVLHLTTASLSDEILDPLLRTTLGTGNQKVLERVLERLLSPSGGLEPALARVGLLLDTLGATGTNLDRLRQSAEAELRSKLEEVDRRLEEAREIAADAGQPVSLRVRATSLLARGAIQPGEISTVLELISPLVPKELREAALSRLPGLLASESSAMVQSSLLGRWSEFLPSTRRELASQFSRRTDTLVRFLEAAREDAPLKQALSSAQRANLRRHGDARIRDIATELFQTSGNSDRARLVARYLEGLPEKRDPELGREVFRTQCASCHQLHGEGTAIGPDLRALADRSPGSLLTSILDPNRAVEDRYLQFAFLLTDGRQMPGVIVEESSSHLRVGTPEGKIETWPRKQILRVSSTGVSLMPEGLEEVISPEQAGHLLAFINRDGASPPPLVLEGGSVTLPSERARIEGDSAVHDPGLGSLTWIARGDRLIWKIRELPAGTYEIFFKAALASSYEGLPFQLEFGEFVVKGQIEHTGSRTGFAERKFGRLRLEEKLEDVTVEFSHELTSDGLSIREIEIVQVR